MLWLEALQTLNHSQTPVVMVTLIGVRGHAPRELGAKMLVTAEATFDTIGGGNLEAVATEIARGMLQTRTVIQQRQVLQLTHEQSLFGVQCCGGEVELLLEPVQTTRATIAIFGMGHVGLALAKVLSILPINLWLIDARAEMLTALRLESLRTGQASIIVREVPVLDGVVADLPPNSHVVMMTHDHSEDLYVLKAALARESTLGYLGLIGSATKWQRFSHKLRQAGFNNLARVTTPIGLASLNKTPEAIAISVAAQLVQQLVPQGEKTHA